MRRVWLGLLVLSLFLISGTLVSAESVQLEFIPDQISANSGFILVATPPVTDESIRMNWLVGDTESGYGLFPKIGSTWSCYFSNTDSMSTCGPTPFIESTADRGIPYELEVIVTNSTGHLSNITKDVTVGGIPINPRVNINYSTNKVNMIVSILDGKYANSVMYAVYKSDLSMLTAGYSPLSIDMESEKWLGSVMLEAKTYYIAFRANNSEDFGGGVVRVSLSEEEGETGILTIDNVDISVLIDSGDIYQRGDYRVINPLNQTISGIYATVPTELSRYIGISFAGNATLGPYESMYYTVTFSNVDSGLSISTKIPVYSGVGTKLATISMKAEISVKDAGGSNYSCVGKSDRTYCIGGICCDESCIKKAECCDSSDCGVGASCDANHRCTSAAGCSTGSECRTGTTVCPDGETYTGTCSGGICCKPESTNECDGKYDGVECTGGKCCNELCITGAECCTSFDCDTTTGEKCDSYTCVPGTAEGPDMTGILMTVIIMAIIGVAGFGVYYYFRKVKGKKEAGEEEQDEDTFEDEEFF